MDNNTSYIENITDLCRNLKLGGMKDGLDRMLEEANNGGWPYERFLPHRHKMPLTHVRGIFVLKMFVFWY